jgi:hypothetical protein
VPVLALMVLSLPHVAAGQQAPPDACEQAVRGHEKLQGLVGLLGRLKEATPLWAGYHPASANYVFVIPGPAGARCAALWRDGSVRASFPLAAAPRFDTPLYGFYRRGRETDQPADLRQRLESDGISEAVILPLDGDARLGLSLTSQSWFIDMALHEAVHLLVQFPSRTGATTPRWPAWTLPQPDRVQLATRCYGSVNPTEQRLGVERLPLLDAAMGAITGSPLANVCRDARAFVTARRTRWREQAGVEVPAESAPGPVLSCAQGEAVMELNEGVPAFVAWLTARELGVVADAQVRSQFTALSRDAFYMTGAMQLTLLRSLAGDEFDAITGRLAESSTWSDGAILSALETALARRCQ